MAKINPTLIDPNLIDRYKITNIQPIKRNGGINNVGNVSCSGFIGTQKVKIFTTYRADLPLLREELESIKFDSPVRFPPLIGTLGRFVVEKWIDGPNLTQIPLNECKNLVPQMVDFLFEFKATPVVFDSTYDHLMCFYNSVINRNDKYKPVARAWLKAYKKLAPIEKHLRHGDLHEGNIILNNGIQYIIDNDGVSFDNGWFLSWHKAYLFSTRFPHPPFIELDNHLELEQQYYGNIPKTFVELTHFLRQSFFKRDLLTLTNKKITPTEIERKW